jgi:glycosyltransferase involved in cell wall biosynthesis
MLTAASANHLSVAAPVRVHILIDTLGVGGAEVLLTEFARISGVDLTIGCLKDIGSSHVVERLRASGLEPRCVGIPPRLGVAAFRRVRRHLSQLRPALVHTHLGYADLLGGPAARSLGIPSVTTIHSHAPPATTRDCIKMKMITVARRTTAARVIAVSESARRAYLASGVDDPDRVVVLRNGIGACTQPGSGRGVRADLGLAPDDLVVAMLSSLRPEKGHDVAIAATRLLLHRFPALRLLVVGDGSLRRQIEGLAARLGDRVVLAGYRQDVMSTLDAADVLLHPSYSDALPTAIIEAMACSVPVVGTDVGGIGELVVNGKTGMLVADPPAPGDLAGALAPLLGDRELRVRLGTGGRQRYEAEFSADRWADRMRDLYFSVLDGAR